MALSHVGTGAVSAAGGVATNPITVTPAFHGGYSVVADDLAVITVVSGHDTEATPTITSGWDEDPGLSASGGGGTFGAGTGPRRLTWFTRRLQPGDTAPTVSLAGTNTGRSLQACITILRRDAGDDYEVAAAFGAETTAGTGWSQATTTNPGITSGDLCVLGYAVRDDQHAAFSAMGVTATGATFGTVSEQADAVTGNGNDQGIGVATVPVTAGTASAAPVLTATIGSSESGEVGLLRVREITLPVIQGPTLRGTFGPNSTANPATSSFTPSADSYLVASFWFDQDALPTIADSLSGSWDLLEAGYRDLDGQFGGFAMWGQQQGSSPAARTVTITAGASAHGGWVHEWTGVDPTTPTGDTTVANHASGASNPIQASVVTTADQSKVIGGLANWDSTTGSTADAGDTLDAESQVSGNAGGMVGHITAEIATSGSTATLGFNRSPTQERGHIVVVELLADLGGGGTEVTGSGAGAFGGLGVATGQPRTLGAGVGSFGGLGTSTGQPRPLGSAAGAFGGLGVATGLPRSIGAAAGAWGFSGTATGTAEAPATEGSGAGDFGGLGTATGVPRRAGAATGSFGGLGSATGQPTTPGSGSGLFGGLGSATGRPRPLGSAVAAFGGLGIAAGTPRVVGSAAGTFGGLGSAQGTTAGTVLGAGAGAFGGLGTAAGQKTVLGVAAGSWGFTGQGTGQPFLEGTAAGPWGGLGAATGLRRVLGAGIGSWGFLGAAEVPAEAVPGYGRAYVDVPGGVAYAGRPVGRAYVDDRPRGKVVVG